VQRVKSAAATARARPPRSGSPALCALLLAVAIALLSLCAGATAASYNGFSAPQPVLLQGYSGSAMEPFITPDGRYLLFNTSNVAPNIPTLQVASRIDDSTFEYLGELEGSAVNEPGSLSGTPSLDRENTLYFISTRSYNESLSTIYAGQFSEGHVTGVHLVSGLKAETRGLVDFDASISPDGSRLYVSVGDFRSGSGPTSASIRLFDRSGEGFAPDPGSATLLRKVNAVATLNYAPAISADGLELFFTAASPAVGQAPTIYRAARSAPSKPFGAAERVASISGFAEAPSLSSDGASLYFHELVGDEFAIERVTRAPTPAPSVSTVSPKKGSANGGTTLHIKGTNLAAVTSVSVGGLQAADIEVRSGSEIRVVSPAGVAGYGDVLVTTPTGTSAPAAGARFGSTPVISAVRPAVGSVLGGTSVEVEGLGFALGSAATTFKFGSTTVAASCAASTTCVLTSPAHRSGRVDLHAVVEGLTSANHAPQDSFEYH
jgi:IPT/TIG domain/WD40-like Beta Propeller Repeat